MKNVFACLLILVAGSVFAATPVKLDVGCTTPTGSITVSTLAGTILTCSGDPCWNNCFVTVPQGTKVTVVASPLPNFADTFLRWDFGDGSATGCNGTTNSSCSFSASSDSKIRALFNGRLVDVTVSRIGTGTGNIRGKFSNGVTKIVTSTTETKSIDVGAVMTFTAEPTTGVFKGWKGDGPAAVCIGSTAPCTFTVTGPFKIAGTIHLN